MRHATITTTFAGLTVLAAISAASAQEGNIPPHVPNNGSATPKITTTAQAGNRSFTYVSTPALRKLVLDSYLADARRKNPARGKMMAATFARTDTEGFYRGLISKTGLSSNDVADIFTVYNLSGWMIANNITTLPPRSQILAIRKQIATGLAKNATATNLATRGELGEKFKILTITLHFGLISARQSGKTKAYADRVAALFSETGSNPHNMVLTDAGFVVKK